MKKRLLTALMTSLGVFFFLPVASLAIKSLTFGKSLSLAQYWELFTVDHAYFKYFWNSVLYAFVITSASIMISLPLGFLFAKVKFRGAKALFFIYIAVMLLPFQATLLPNYIRLRDLGFLNTPLALTLPMIFSPFAVFLTRQFMTSVPDELIDYAQLETSSALKIMRCAVLPQIKPAISALAVLIFCESWNIVEQALIFSMDNPEIYPLSVKLAELPEDVASAGGAVYMFPALMLFLIFRKPLETSMESYKL